MRLKLENIRILIIDDTLDFCETISEYLINNNKGVDVRFAVCLGEGRSSLECFEPHLILLDKNLGEESGFTFINEVRADMKYKSVPIMIVTGSDALSDKIEAFRLGADDLLVKPITMVEMEARIVALLRRSSSYSPAEQEIALGYIRLKMRNQEVFANDMEVNLTETEYRILLELVLNNGEIVYRERLAAKSLSSRHTGPKTLNVHIASLRKKLGDEISSQIKTIRGRGFMFCGESAVEKDLKS